MFKVKICGVRLKSDVTSVAAAGGDAIGLNFFPPSARYVDPHENDTRALSAHAKDLGVKRVGVFVNASAEEADQTARTVGLDSIQLHGDETIEVAQEIISRGFPVIRAIKLPTVDLTSDLIAEACEGWTRIGCHLLLDADAGQSHGGSGKCLDWTVVGTWAQSHPSTSWSLAGGLNPGNVHQAIVTSGATSVDTASGVEQTRGIKSPEQIAAFVAASLQTLSQ